MEKSPEYRIWIDMRRRCHQPHRPDYKNYGGRGIKVCAAWRFGADGLCGFATFYRDMGQRPSSRHTLDRKRNADGYSKDNCRWLERRFQDRNKRTNHLIEVDGVRMTIMEASERYGLKPHTLYNRILTLKWPAERAAKTPAIAPDAKRGRRGPYKKKKLSSLAKTARHPS